MNRSVVALILLMLAGPGCGGSGSDVPGGRCLTDAEICQFHEGVSTRAQVQAALGNPTMSVSNGGIEEWVYICQANAQTQTVDEVVFFFDQTGVVQSVGVLRSGPGISPAPVCGQG